MALIKLIGFAGEIPKLQARLLPETAAQLAYNTRLTRGDLAPVRTPVQVYAFPPPLPANGYKTIYNHKDVWYGWNKEVWACPGPVADDRLYYMGDGAPKMQVGGTTYPLAVNQPSAALVAALSGSATVSGQTDTRLYVYTFVTSFGEESAPSPVSNSVDWNPGQTVTLSGFQA